MWKEKGSEIKNRNQGRRERNCKKKERGKKGWKGKDNSGSGLHIAKQPECTAGLSCFGFLNILVCMAQKLEEQICKEWINKICCTAQILANIS